ncbi:DNA topoisomerase III [Pseudoalteromonas luteoviolacea B = ATCC 29581]|nr:DNA topoisomerase III [Pseudoalteromonas luteoviolacea B = ATCC 29581]
MKLYIAEKPSLAKAIIAALPKPHRRQDGCYVAANGDMVTWCIGHLLELAEPHYYNPKFEKWSLEHLPITPSEWKNVPKGKTKKQLNIVVKLIKSASHIVHAGDPDREGQLLVDEVLHYSRATNEKIMQAQRLLISDLNISAVSKALNNLKKNSDYSALSRSALARSRADWLYGINLTRLYTLLGRSKGAGQVLSVGRVQTPVLGIIVRRDEEIEQFSAKPFFEVHAQLKDTEDNRLTAKWIPSEACRPYMDDAGRVLVKGLAENVVSRIVNKTALVTSIKGKDKRINPPLPYNLSALQIDANKIFGYSAKQVLDVSQALYEKHKLITYPRSDNRFLPEEHFMSRYSTVEAIRNNVVDLQDGISLADLEIKNAAWNDKKVEAHHAIVPTTKKANMALSVQEKNIYALVSRQYLMQFFLPYRYKETKIELEIAGGLFVAKEKVEIEKGFQVLLPNKVNGKSSTLPPLDEGQMLTCFKADLVEKMTTPPEYFTDATLITAMTGVSKFVHDKDIKAILKETDGLGTEATRAGIIDLLINRQFISREGKQLRSTMLGKALINSIPRDLSLPDRTAIWEANLSKIAAKTFVYNDFIIEIESELRRFVDQASRTDMVSFQGLSNYSSSKKRRFRGNAKKIKHQDT